jgi:hypothetical protein
MKHIAVTHVDSRTKVPGFKAPMRNGPSFPDVKGLNIIWWDASRWPIEHPDDYPLFYGTCDDDADIESPGVMMVITEETYNELYEMELRNRLPSIASPLQIRLALIKLGMLDTIQSFISNLEEPAKTIIYTEWEYATEINKHSNSIQSLASRLGLTSSDIDDIFTIASNIRPGSLDPFNPFPETEAPIAEE